MKNNRGDTIILSAIVLACLLLAAFFLFRPYIAALIQNIAQVFS